MRSWTDEELLNAVEAGGSISDVIRRIGLNPKGANFSHVKHHMNRLGVDVEPLKNSTINRPGYKHYSDAEVFIENSSYRSNEGIKKRLISNGTKKRECDKCQLTEWNGEPIPLELEHVNGIPNDNRVENLSFLCPNCHAQTPTYRGRNYKGRKQKQLRECAGCATILSAGTIGDRCSGCFKRKPKIDWPETRILLDKLKTMSYTALAKELGVSDNAIRKHLKNHPKTGG